jgi:RND family efflux transporter MFP subunit
VPVDLVTLRPTRVTDAGEYLAQLRPRTATAIQPQVEGHIIEIAVRSGDLVEASQPLMQIDPGRQPAAVTQARASRAAREVTAQLQHVELERSRRLYAQGAIPKDQLDQTQAAYEGASADVRALSAEIAANDVQLSYYKIVAPARGIVGDIPVRVGDRVTTQTALTTVTDNTVLEAYVQIPVEHTRDVHPGTEVQLVDVRGGLLATSEIRFISPRVDPQTQLLLVEADIDNRDGIVRADQIVRAHIVWSSHEGLMIPALAVTRLGGQTFVYVAQDGPQGMIAKQLPVEVGQLTNNAYVVMRGLAPGDRVVTSSIQKLRDGAAITAKPAVPPSTQPRS